MVQAARAGAVRAALGNHVDVAARWLQQRRCHIDVVRCGGRRGAGGAGEAGAPDEVPAAGECETWSAQSPGLSLLKSYTLVTLRRLRCPSPPPGYVADGTGAPGGKRGTLNGSPPLASPACDLACDLVKR
jgi:hypothetical protein